jgi:wyosine [tRNA(Phe)-imidazoG37] synthetase (radical SAM superfamily)
VKYTFGPVPSRRLGVSLGVDIVPFKTCSFDCIYCQLGATTDKSVRRQSYVPKGEVLRELREVLDSESDRIDFVTFSGSGEPTLNSDIGSMIGQIKTFTEVPVAVLTNGSLFCRDDVRRDLGKADLVVPSLDAVTESTFARINRPHESLTVELIIEGLRKFTREFVGQIWLEIMLVKGVNDSPEELRQMADLVRGLRVGKIHLNTVERPPAEEFALAISAEEMRDIVSAFDSRAEVITDFDRSVSHETRSEDMESEILSLLKRRPCTVDDISNSLGIHMNEVIKHVNHLTRNGTIRRVKHGDKWYYEQTSEVWNFHRERMEPRMDTDKRR